MNRIPSIYHFVFGLRPQTEPFHLCYYLCIASCLKVNQPERIYFHYQHLPYGPWWDRIKDRLTLHRVEPDAFFSSYKYADRLTASFRYAHLADLTRLQMLHEFGGVYADMDTLFIRPVPSPFYTYPCVMGKERVDWDMPAARQAGGSLCNAVIMAERGSEFIRAWLERIYDEFDGSWSTHSTFLPYRLSQEHPSWIHIEEEESFFGLDWTQEGIRSLFERETDVPGAYSLHLWSHLWWDRDRTEYTCFHQGRLTPEYVAFANTTYSKLARRFLPKDLILDASRYRQERRKQAVENLIMKLRRTRRRIISTR